MPLSLNEIRDRARAFAREWEGETSERAEAQSFWNDFFHVFGKKRRSVAVYEQKARRFTGKGSGRIDLFWPGVMLAEHKSEGRDLDNYFAPRRLSPLQGEEGFFILYYQFVKHAFGLRYAAVGGQRTSVRLMFDELPDTLEKRARFKAYLAALDRSPEFRRSRISLDARDIAELDSRRSAPSPARGGRSGTAAALAPTPPAGPRHGSDRRGGPATCARPDRGAALGGRRVMPGRQRAASSKVPVGLALLRSAFPSHGRRANK